MAQSVLELILRSKKQGDAAKQVESDLGKMGKAADQSGRSFKVFDGIALAAGQKVFDLAQSALRAVPELVEIGIQSDRAKVALEAYAGGGEQAAEMLEAVTDASGGAIDKISAMQNATRLLSMGLANNSKEAANLTKIAVTLGATMGRGPQEAFEEFTLLLANQSILRLDTFGISGANVKQRMEELAEATGETDRQTLFLTATMEEATKKLNALDAAGFQAVSNIDRLKSTVADAKIGVGEWLADGLMPWIDGIFGVRDALDDQQKSLLDSTDGYEDFSAEMAKALGAAGPLALGFRLLTEEEYNLRKQTDETKESTESFDRAILNAKTSTDEFTESVEENKEEQERLKDELGNLHYLISGPVGDAYDDFSEKNAELWLKTEELRQKIRELEDRKYLTKDQKTQLQEAYAELDEVTASAQELKVQHDETTKSIIFNLLEQQLAIDGWTNEEFLFLQEVANRWGLIDDKTLEATKGMQTALSNFAESGDVDAALLALDAIKDKADAIPNDIDVNVNVRYREYGTPPVNPGDTNRRRRQHGGDVWPGEMFLVGERGPELFIPQQNGYIMPASQTQQVVNNYSNTFNLSASYAMQSEGSLRDDVRMLMQLYGRR